LTLRKTTDSVGRAPFVIFCLLGLLLSPAFPAQIPAPATELRGTVRDAKTKEPIPNALVKVIEPGKKSLTDKDGGFQVRGLTPGTYSLEFSAAGYRTLVRKDISLQEGHSIVLSVELEVALPRLNEQVTVTGTPIPTAGQPAVSVRKVDQLEITRTPASFRDLSRVLSSIPGATQVSEKSNDLIVRGGSPWENGFYVDNIPIPNINHFQNQAGVGGAIGVLDVSLIDNIDFYTGGFPAAYGDRMSSIVDIRFREGARDRIRSRLNLHLAGFGGAVEGPLFKGKASFVLSARRGYYDLIAKLLGYAVAPNYGDIHFKFTVDLDARNKLTLLNIFGASRLSYDLETAVEEGLNASLDYRTGQNTVGLNWLRTSDRGYSNTSLSYSAFKNSATIVAVNPEAASSKYSATDEGKGEVVLRNVNVVQIRSRSQLEFGVELKAERFDFNNYISNYVNRWEIEMPPLDAQGTDAAWKSALFATWIYRPFEILSVSLGARTDYFSLTQAWHVAPRLSASFKILDRLTLKAAWGIYDQGLPLFLTAENPENRKKRDPYTTQVIAGLRYDLGNDTQLIFEAYAKDYGNVPLTPDDPTNYVLDSGVDFGFYRTYSVLYDTGLARAQGFEILLQKKTADKLYGILSAAVGRTRYRDYTGTWRYRIIDYQYLISAVGGYKPNDKWTFGGRLKLAGGRPYTPYDVERSTALNRGILDKTQVLAKRYPPFMSLSVQANRQFRYKRSVLNVYISVMNLLNQKNVDRYFWDRVHNQMGTVYQAPIVPEFGIEYIF
jgi:hypothetical protein